MVALVNLSSGVLVTPHVALSGSPLAVAARTRSRRAEGVLEGVCWVPFMLLDGSVGWERGVDSEGGPVSWLLVRVGRVGVPASAMIISGMGCCTRAWACAPLGGECGEGDSGGDGEGSARARAIMRPSVISFFPAGFGDMKIEGDGLFVRLARFGAGVERPDGVGGGRVGLPDSISAGSSAIWDPSFR